MGALIAFVAAIAFCAVTVFLGPALAEQAGLLLGEANQSNYPLLETVAALIVFGALLLFALGGAKLMKVAPLAIGRAPLRMGAIGAAIGLGGLLATAAYAWIAGALTAGPAASGGFDTLLWGTLLILFMASVEEIYFHGWLQPAIAARYGIALALLLSALAFAALHLMGGARSAVSLLNLFLGGVLFGLLAARGGGLAGAIAAHFAWNWSEQILLGVDPNPGVGSFGALANYDLAGPALWGGSDEGLNASLAMTMVLIALVVPLLILARTGAAADPVLVKARPGAVGA